MNLSGINIKYGQVTSFKKDLENALFAMVKWFFKC